MYVLLLTNCKIDIFFGTSILSYNTIYTIITILRTMFSSNANKYNYDYNYYHNGSRIKINQNRYILNEDQNMDDDYGFFVILDQDIDPLRIYMNNNIRRDTMNKCMNVNDNKNDSKNTNTNTNTNIEILILK